MTSEAIVVGVNKYQHLQPLDYAQQDAKAVAEFLKTEARFDHVYYFVEDAEPINGVSMQPTQNNLRRILQTRVAKRRVPEVVRECLGDRVNQFPYSIAEPINKSHLILMPQHSRPEDLNVLKIDALWAEKRGDLRLALQCWLRVNVASGGLDADFHDAVFDLRLKLREPTIQPPKPKSQTTSEIPLDKGDLGGSSTEIEPIKDDSLVVIDHKTVDYSKLQQLLKDKQWRKADGETHNLMNNIIGTASLVRKLKNYPQDTIEKIDRLWADASDEKFGFFAQARIWQQVNRDKSEFEIKVGWRLPNAAKAINQSKLKLNLEEAEVGHFPAFFKSWGGGGWSFTEHLLDRVSEFLDSDNNVENN